jgi:hypothetical protein
MYLETPKKKVTKSSREVFDFLNDVKNFETLMPENISKFELINESTFLFALKGMPEIVLQKKQQTPYSQLILGAANDKLPFTLTADITAISEQESEVTLSFEGEFNAMMAMMIKSPINNFLTTLSENLSKI